MWVPIGKGMQQQLDATARPVDVPVALEDVVLAKSGRAETRLGFHRMPLSAFSELENSTTPISSGRHIFPSGGGRPELCLLDNNFLWTWSPTKTDWIKKGPVSPFSGKQSPIFPGEHNHTGCDLAEHAGYVLHVGTRDRQIDAGAGLTSFARSNVFQVRDSGGGVVVDTNFTTDTNVSVSKYHAAGASSSLGNLWAYYQQGEVGPTNTLGRLRFPTSNPNSFTGPVTVATDVKFLQRDERSYDVMPITTGVFAGGFILCYAQVTTDAIVQQRYDASGTLQSSASLILNTPYNRVAICENPSDPLTFFLLTDSGTIDPVWSLRLYRMNKSISIAPDAGPVTVSTQPTGTLSIGASFNDLGVSAGEVGASATAVVCTWSGCETGGSYVNDSVIGNRTHNGSVAGLTALDIAEYSYNARLVTKPWIHGGRAFVTGATNVGPDTLTNITPGFQIFGVAPSGAPWDSLFTVDLRSADTATGSRQPHLVGVHDVGQATIGTRAVPRGRGNNVIRMPDYAADPSGATLSDQWRYASEHQARLHFNEPIVQNTNEVKLDFSAMPTHTDVRDGAVAISGGVISWYDGQDAFELGHLCPPVPFTCVQSTVAGATLADGTYQYIAHWAFHDAAGFLHRSIPSPPFEVLVTGAPNATDSTYRNQPVTSRLQIPAAQVAAQVFRGEDDGTYGRVSLPQRMLRNVDSAYQTEVFQDTGFIRSEPIYTQGGDIEAVIPEGAAIVTVANGRVFLGRNYRRNRVAFSKRFPPGTATETQVAPEFNEGFSTTLNDHQDISAMSSLDDKLVLFTTDDIFLLVGRGPLDNGTENDFSELTKVHSGLGCTSVRSAVETPGGVMFGSDAGIHLLDRSLSVSFIGEAVEDDTSLHPVITSAIHDVSSQLVLFTCVSKDRTSGIVLVFDYGSSAWLRWQPRKIGGYPIVAVSACMHNGQYHMVEASGLVWRQALDTDLYAYLDDQGEWVRSAVEFADVFGGEPGGWQRLSRFVPVIERLEPGESVGITATMVRDGVTDPVRNITANTISQMEGVKVPIEIRPHRQNCQSMRLRLETTRGDAAVTGRGLSISGVLVHVRPRTTAARVQEVQRT